MKSELMLLTALAFSAVQAHGPNTAEHSARYRTAKPRVAPSPGEALPGDSLNCRLIGQYPNPDGVHYGVGAVVGNLAYLTAGDSGMAILSVSNPASPYLVGHLVTIGTMGGVYVDGNYAYVAAGSDFEVIDVSDSTNPHKVGGCSSGGWAVGVVKRGDYAYVTDYTHGLRVIDVSSPTSPQVVGFCSSFGAQGVVLVGNYACVSNAYSESLDGVRVIDISNPTAPTESSYYRTYCAEGIDVLGSHYVFVDDGTWMRVIDVSNAASPVEVGYYDNGGYCYGVDVVGNYAYAACDGGLLVMDVSDPTDPREAGYYRPPDSYWRNAVKCGRYVYASEYYSGLQIVEFSGDTTGYGGEEGRRPPACSSQLTVTIVRGVIFLTGDGRRETGDRAALLDAAGRRVIELQPGPNDVQHLSTGVYFVSSPRSVEKVVLTR